MKTTLRAKLLQHLAGKKKADEGFTLIELLVVIIIIGILAAIALPSFLNQANKARQTEATTTVGAINRGQQAYNLETQFFSKTIDGLGIGVQVDTNNYDYEELTTGGNPNRLAGLNGATIDETVSNDIQDDAYRTGGIVYAVPDNNAQLKGYTGASYLLSVQASGETTSTIILCETSQAGDPVEPDPTVDPDNALLLSELACGDGSIQK